VIAGWGGFRLEAVLIRTSMIQCSELCTFLAEYIQHRGLRTGSGDGRRASFLKVVDGRPCPLGDSAYTV